MDEPAERGPMRAREPMDPAFEALDGLARAAALDGGPLPHVIVSRAGRLTFANLPARALFGIGLGDIGRPFRDLDISHRPVELRRPVEQAMRDRRRVAVGEAGFAPREGEDRRVDVTAAPLLGPDGDAIGVSIVFEDVTRYARLQTEVAGHRHQLEQAYEELQSTIDELETTHEELQSANEELQTTIEALQSTNAQLETINDELRERTGELDRVNDVLEGLLTSLAVAVVVVDRGRRVRVWNRRAEDLWGVREDEALEQDFLALDAGLPTGRLAAALRAVLAGASEHERLELDAVDRRGRAIVCATDVLPLPGAGREGPEVSGAVILMQDGPRRRSSG